MAPGFCWNTVRLLARGMQGIVKVLASVYKRAAVKTQGVLKRIVSPIRYEVAG